MRVNALGWLTERRIVALLIVLGVLVRAPLVFTPLTYSHSDDWRQADTATIARNFYESGYDLFYPQVNWGGVGPGYVETEFQLYPFLIALLYAVFGEQVWLGRLVSLLFTVPTFILFYLLARRILKRMAALWALFFFVISPLGIRYSVAYMPEATVFFFYVAALYLFVRWLDEERSAILWLAGLSTALAILVKPTSIHIGLVFLILLLARHGLRIVTMWRLWVFGLISLVPGAVWYLHARNLYLTYGNTFGLLSGGDSKLGSLDYWLSPGFYLNLARLEARWVFGWVGVLAFIVGLVVYLRRRERRSWLLLAGVVTIAIYYMVVARYAQEAWGIQYHIYFIPYAALGVGLGLAWLFEGWNVSLRGLRESPRALVGLGLALLLLVAGGYIYRDLFVPSNQFLATCGEAVASITPEEALLVVSTTSQIEESGVPNNYQEPQIFFYADRRGWSLPSEWHQPDHLERFQEKGAAYFVIYSEELYEDNPALAGYLDANAEQVGPGLQEGCAVYRLSETSE